MLTITAIKLAASGLLGGAQVPTFMKTALFWKVVALIFAAWFIWHKASASADTRWEVKLAHAKARLLEERDVLAELQRIDDKSRIAYLEGVLDENVQEKQQTALRRQKFGLSQDCNLCRVPRRRSDRRVR